MIFYSHLIPRTSLTVFMQGILATRSIRRSRGDSKRAVEEERSGNLMVVPLYCICCRLGFLSVTIHAGPESALRLL